MMDIPQDVKDMTLVQKVEHLSKMTMGPVHLHHVSNEKVCYWSVHVQSGSRMVLVPTSIQESAEASVTMALNRWYNRSEREPFV